MLLGKQSCVRGAGELAELVMEEGVLIIARVWTQVRIWVFLEESWQGGERSECRTENQKILVPRSSECRPTQGISFLWWVKAVTWSDSVVAASFPGPRRSQDLQPFLPPGAL